MFAGQTWSQVYCANNGFTADLSLLMRVEGVIRKINNRGSNRLHFVVTAIKLMTIKQRFSTGVRQLNDLVSNYPNQTKQSQCGRTPTGFAIKVLTQSSIIKTIKAVRKTVESNYFTFVHVKHHLRFLKLKN